MTTNDNDIASKFKVTIRILFVFGGIIVLIIRIIILPHYKLCPVSSVADAASSVLPAALKTAAVLR